MHSLEGDSIKIFLIITSLLGTHRLKSWLQQAYIKGFIIELSHPSHVTTWKSMAGMTFGQMTDIMFMTKNGSQQMMKTPMTVPSVLAAFFSFANFDIFFDMMSFNFEGSLN